ncbi:MAG: hypothetical protein ACOYM3_16865 [Terrimicrobiaceae bacterium]
MKPEKITFWPLPGKAASVGGRMAAGAIEDDKLTFLIAGPFPTVLVEDLPVSRRTGGQDERTTTTSALGGGRRQQFRGGR